MLSEYQSVLAGRVEGLAGQTQEVAGLETQLLDLQAQFEGQIQEFTQRLRDKEGQWAGAGSRHIDFCIYATHVYIRTVTQHIGYTFLVLT